MTQAITPYLTVKGAEAAIAFYAKAFGAKETFRMPADDGKRLMHASIELQGGTIMLSDEFPEHGGCGAPAAGGGASPVAIAITLKAPEQVDAIFGQAVGAGAKGHMPPNDAFWGDRFAMLDDPFGHRWMLSAPLPK